MSKPPDTKPSPLADQTNLKKRLANKLKAKTFRKSQFLPSESYDFFESGVRLFVDPKTDLDISVT